DGTMRMSVDYRALNKATVQKNKYLVPLVIDLMDGRILEEHINHLSLVLSHFRKYKLYVKMEKCEFAQQEIKISGYLVSKNQVRNDPKKVQAIVD
uniref:Reverse transcriptase domain-containing protein n=1 Tax=Solanum lycopersicum TaxID=4081 RepID=A0A3Q7EBL7_SOLLC